ncbi:MAG TPA: DUF4105 domain-containing protein [Candidatus Binatia bacterium]
MRVFLNILLGITITAITLWGVGALYFSPLLPARWRAFAAASYGTATILAFALLPSPGRTAIAAIAIFAILVVLFFHIPASNDRDWQPDVAVTPYASVNGDLVTIHGVRNFDYRTETDFTPRWEERTYDLRKLDSVDIIAVYWTGKAIAHVMVSFGFEGKDYLAMSIETRKEKGESYSTLAGFFRQYELYYVVADERDVIGVRTTYRQPQEDVYIYRVRARQRTIRQVFLDYIETISDMRVHPRFYNTLTTNCTTSILTHTRINPESPPMSWKVLLSGYVPDYLYELGRIDTAKPFADLEKLSRVNERAHAADKDASFSQRLRQGLPKPASLP